MTASEMRAYRVTSGSLEELPDRVAAIAAPSTTPKEEAAVPNGTPIAVEPPKMTNEQKAIAFAIEYHNAWSMGKTMALQFMDKAYGSVVDFYGKPVAKALVVADKKNFALRWPTRAYDIKHGSERARCEATCRVSGVVEWYAKRDIGDRVLGTYRQGAPLMALPI